MTFLFKFVTVIILTTFISINLVESSNYTCTHDEMRVRAVEACENIFNASEFMEDDGDNRDKREIWNTKYNTNGIGEYKNHHSKLSFDGNEIVKVRRKDYPEGGFIRININHAKILRRTDNDYKIIHRKLHNKFGYLSEKQYRHKRNIVTIQMEYCCIHRCKDDVLCTR